MSIKSMALTFTIRRIRRGKVFEVAVTVDSQ